MIIIIIIIMHDACVAIRAVSKEHAAGLESTVRMPGSWCSIPLPGLINDRVGGHPSNVSCSALAATVQTQMRPAQVLALPDHPGFLRYRQTPDEDHQAV